MGHDLLEADDIRLFGADLLQDQRLAAVKVIDAVDAKIPADVKRCDLHGSLLFLARQAGLF